MKALYVGKKRQGTGEKLDMDPYCWSQHPAKLAASRRARFKASSAAFLYFRLAL